jgi:ABC-type branched-subunit amino acid transport system substrate-binding protein
MTTVHRFARAAAAFALAGLASSCPVWASDPTPGVTDKEIRLGAYIPLSGPVAAYGIPLQAGMQAAVQRANDAGGFKGRRFNLLTEDNKFNPQATVAIARKMITRDGIFAFATPMGTPATAAVIDYVTKEAKVPLINPYAGNAEWYTPPRENFYGVQVPLEHQARVIGRWAAKDGHKKIVVVYLTLATNERMGQEFEKAAKKLNPGISVEQIATKLGNTDFGPMAIEIAAKKPDAIALMLTQGETVALAKELRTQKVNAPLYSYAGLVINSLIDLAGPAVEGFKAVSYTVPPDSDSPAVRDYRAALAKVAPNEKPDYLSLNSYAMMTIVLEAIRRIDGPITRPALIKAIEGMRNFETGILPPVSYSASQHLGTTALQRVQIRNGKWQVIGEPVDGEKDW